MKGGELSPERFALSAAVGLFVGAQPYYGAHIVLCTLICIPLRLNTLIAYLVAWYSIPPLMPFLLYLSLQIGHLVFADETSALSWDDLSSADLLNATSELVVGAAVLGLSMSLIFTPLIYTLARRFKKKSRQVHHLPMAFSYQVFELYRDLKQRERRAVLLELRVQRLGELLVRWFSERKKNREQVLVVNSGRGEACFFMARAQVEFDVVGLEASTALNSIVHSAQECYQQVQSKEPWPKHRPPKWLEFAQLQPQPGQWDAICIMLRKDVDAQLQADSFYAALAQQLRPGGEVLLMGPSGSLFHALRRRLAGYSDQHFSRRVSRVTQVMTAEGLSAVEVPEAYRNQVRRLLMKP